MDNQEKARKIKAFSGLTQISIRINHAERDQETSKAEARMASWLLYLTQSYEHENLNGRFGASLCRARECQVWGCCRACL